MPIMTSESVTEGHPDKVCDYISDSILDAYLAGDPESRVACEALCKGDTVILAGEITSRATADHEAVVRRAIRDVGYTDPSVPFHAAGVKIVQLLSPQAPEIAHGVGGDGRTLLARGAGDQGMMYGYATAETPELMPLPILLAHRLTAGLAEARRSGRHPWLRPDGKTQVCVRYEGSRPVAVTHIVVSTQHAGDTPLEAVRAFVIEELAPAALGEWHHGGIRFLVNPAGTFVQGGPSADCGLTGRKIVVDTYGGIARTGGGCFSGKDPSKVDRSGAYFCRYVARRIVEQGLATRAEVRVAYAIGVADPLCVEVETFGTGDPADTEIYAREFDFRPGAIIERLDLLRPIYRRTTNYGHFGRPGLPWEETAVRAGMVAEPAGAP
ncbi:MAG: methionine adenosyltransferase [Gemmatimonadetes bacterium]|nr:methionine adenosyltransferase [Gemmatimonadota bacterium]